MDECTTENGRTTSSTVRVTLRGRMAVSTEVGISLTNAKATVSLYGKYSKVHKNES